VLITQDDRRAFHRMAIETGVKVTKGESELQGICKDLSSTGMSIQLTDKSLKAGDQIEVLLDTDHPSFPPLNAQAVVLRLLEQDGHYLAAIEFTTVK
jgi:hypothetical protein